MSGEAVHVSGTDRYLRAIEAIPRGETRTFTELARAVGRPGAARAVGRAVTLVPSESRLPWQRVVAAGGGFARDPERAVEQLRRLRREGARPRRGESVSAWARRTGLVRVGDCRSKRYLPADDPRIDAWNPERVEGFARERDTLERRYLPPGAQRSAGPGLPVLGEAHTTHSGKATPSIAQRIASLAWPEIEVSLRGRGVVRLLRLLRSDECRAILAEGSRPSRFDRSVVMEPKGYGVGEYHYWKEPLPELVDELRTGLYARLATFVPAFSPGAREFPSSLATFWRQCRAAGQKRPSSILIGYGLGGINHPHRDIYGKLAFPLQALIVLNKRGRDFEGGEFAFWKEQSDGELHGEDVAADQGDLLIFATRGLPAPEGRRVVPVSHGMRVITRGTRYGLGLVFHLAK